MIIEFCIYMDENRSGNGLGNVSLFLSLFVFVSLSLPHHLRPVLITSVLSALRCCVLPPVLAAYVLTACIKATSIA